jgi:hypothetical protein
MIVFDLLCRNGHRFEGWFGSADDFASQRERKLLACPSCGSAQVERVPSATRANLGAEPPKPPKAPRQPQQPQPAQPPARTPDMEGKDPFAIAQMLYSRMLDDLLTKTEDVGRDFPQEARKIFYRRTDERPIRGQATQQEHEELIDEGIPVARLPVPPKDNLN